MNDCQPGAPKDFSNSNTAEIIKLEQQYVKGVTEGKVFEELQSLREQIKVLKSKIGLLRKEIDKINED